MTIASFALLFMGLIAIGQQAAVYYPNAMMPWMAPIYPFFIQPHPYYNNGRLDFNPVAIDQRERNPESRNRYRPNRINDYESDDIEEDVESNRASSSEEHDVMHTGSGTLNVYPAASGIEQRSRGKSHSSSSGNNAFNRFLGTGVNIGTGATGNYLLRTSFVFVTATGTLCLATSCIPAALFMALSSNVICGRRKRDVELIDSLNISPTNVAKLVPTASLTLEQIKFDAKLDQQSDGATLPTLDSSFVDNQQDSFILQHQHLTENDYERQKRFLFVLTTTVTTYSFVTSTYTSTISPAAAGALTCRPAGIALC